MIPQSKVLHDILNKSPIKSYLASRRFFVRAYFDYVYLRRDAYHPRRPEKQEVISRAFDLIKGLDVRNALDIGCGEGHWSHRLTEVARHVLAIDISGKAVRRARELYGHNEKVNFQVVDLLTETKLTPVFDLIFCAEVLYYFERDQLETVTGKMVELLPRDGRLLLVHSRSSKDDSSGLALKEIGAKTIHEGFIRRTELCVESDSVDERFRITLLRRL